MNPILAIARSVWEIPHLCSCDGWRPPDYRLPPAERRWILGQASPRCALHGIPAGALA